jgi:hypothetical protein
VFMTAGKASTEEVSVQALPPEEDLCCDVCYFLIFTRFLFLFIILLFYFFILFFIYFMLFNNFFTSIFSSLFFSHSLLIILVFFFSAISCILVWLKGEHDSRHQSEEAVESSWFGLHFGSR